jgi:colanic acid/amylovoran biosynthesis glycosyltransferase
MKPDDLPRPLTIAYLVNQYPMVSHSFIRREIAALERLGLTVHRVAVRGWSGTLADPEDQAERTRTRFLLQGGAKSLVGPMLRTLIASPMRFAEAAALAWRSARVSEKSLPHHLVYLAEACLLLGWLREWRVQHLHAHFGTNGAQVAMLANALGGPSFSFTAHGPEEFDRPQALSLGEKIRRAKFVAAISSFGRSQLFRWVDHTQWAKVHVVHCGLEQAFHAGAVAKASSAPQLVCVGRLCEQKGQLLLMEAARLLKDRGVKFTLVLAGDGEMRPEIEASIARHGLGTSVRITGWISGAQVRTELLAARALVLASFAEGLPVVIMEAMSLRRPVLSTFVAGIPELVQPGESGWLVPAGDVERLADAMAQCLQTPDDVLARMGEAARARALARHDVDTEAAKLAALFEHATQRQKA